MSAGRGSELQQGRDLLTQQAAESNRDREQAMRALEVRVVELTNSQRTQVATLKQVVKTLSCVQSEAVCVLEKKILELQQSNNALETQTAEMRKGKESQVLLLEGQLAELNSAKDKAMDTLQKQLEDLKRKKEDAVGELKEQLAQAKQAKGEAIVMLEGQLAELQHKVCQIGLHHPQLLVAKQLCYKETV